ncbi:class II fructose-bisphosphate aldolase family protein [Brachyspira hyodysenteriae]|uniref:Fruktose-biphosphate aldolase n=1 Tax=Brachyspira hyodysenteriae (strain ATCC 49526 / WA1) TaxID=565034 RepID=A0A3B6VGM8_BRAHW|nr:class II fructose-bisphosphate aldolase [Brachyspira hyodysenteriae]ACN84234.1 fruktose-biphosphate aldolase [Brachyspira hyodysenteriae WA1]AUJ49962.1 fructose-bisphosphate aldolase [Brachyspira hyodysenteriae]KLI19295.1 fructose-bisphosphate aldolase [Brachyspira hyodysenteriae]KLI19476.1 fructose-bisphosphate aldolase [Brachyspira hyodysenteriae]KLI22586.1 fructose-bisphosphate aldolase [Brachyspira hyodysenteriae]
MSIVTLKDALNRAKDGKYGIGAFNVSSFTFLETIIKAAEDKKSPVITQIAEGHVVDMPNFESFCKAAVDMASKASVPVVLHLDHGLTLNTVVRCIQNGFSSIMIDASAYPYEENIRRTKEIVNICHSVGISVEGELGTIGGSEANIVKEEDAFTNPDEALDFVKKTEIDALAISIGNVHGNYKGEPKLDFERLETISKLTNLPLVLHGGSGIYDDDFRKAVSLGICKINFYTGNCKSAGKAVMDFVKEDPEKNGTDLMKLIKGIRNNVYETVCHNMDVFGSSNKAW